MVGSLTHSWRVTSNHIGIGTDKERSDQTSSYWQDRESTTKLS